MTMELTDSGQIRDPDSQGSTPKSVLDERDSRLRDVHSTLRYKHIHRRYLGSIENIEVYRTRRGFKTKDCWITGLLIEHSYDGPLPDFLEEILEDASVARDVTETENGNWAVAIMG